MAAPRARSVILLAGIALLATLGCRDDTRTSIDRETFVNTYVDLRKAALETPGGRITPERRDEVLERHGVSEADLFRFAEVRGADVAYMASVWNEVEARLEPDTVPGTLP
jgi:hypothetical protein